MLPTPSWHRAPSSSWRDHAERLLAYAEPVSRAGLYVSLAIIYAWFGGMKFTDYEANGLVPLVRTARSELVLCPVFGPRLLDLPRLHRTQHRAADRP